MSNKKTLAEQIKDFENKASKGLAFVDRVAIPPINYLDAVKKSACDEIWKLWNESSLSEKEFSERCGAFSELEIKAIKAHRIEILNLERLVQLIERFTGNLFLENTKRDIINKAKLEKYRNVSDLSWLPIDHLVLESESAGVTDFNSLLPFQRG